MCRGVFVAAASVGVVETLKDQGYGRWNNSMKSIAQRAKNQTRSSSTHAKKLSSTSSSAIPKKPRDENEKERKAEESLRIVMFLSTWGPNS